MGAQQSQGTIDSTSLRRAWNQATRARRRVNVICVGAGIGNLYCATQLAATNESIVIFESSNQVGGRIRTLPGNIDRGAWRVHDSHHRMHKLARSLDIDLVPTHSSQTSKTFAAPTSNLDCPQLPGLSLLQSNAVQTSFARAKQIELRTGYLGLQDGAKRSYTVKSDPEAIFRVPTGGMSAFPIELHRRLPPNVETRLKSRVVSLTYEAREQVYWLEVQDRRGQSSYWAADTVILGCQPAHLPATNFDELLAPIKASVSTRPLTHVYCKTDRPVEPLYHITSDELGQHITTGPTTLMAAYAGGEAATLHQRYWLQNKNEYSAWLNKRVNQHFKKLGRGPVRLSDPQVFYYKHAVGIWNPNVLGKTCMREASRPHPVRLPNLYWVNETFSDSYQGWGEGSLEVAEHVLLQTYKPTIYKTIPDNALGIDGRVIDMTNWLDRHPGGKKVIQHYLGKDVTAIFKSIHLTKSGVQQLILPLQIGFIG